MTTTQFPKYSTIPNNPRTSRNRDLPLLSKTVGYSLLVKGEQIPLSETEYKVILDTLTALRQGESITVIPDETYMTTQQAADLLNVSRPHFVKLLESGDLPFIKVGNRRKVLAKDVLDYKNKRDAERHQILQEFSRELAEDGFYDLDYDEVSQIINED